MKKIEITVGTNRGQSIDASDEDAEKAIAEGWARDPHGMQLTTPPARSPEDQAKLEELAKAGSERLQQAAKQKPDQQPAAKDQPTRTRDMHQSGTTGTYPTKNK